MVAYITHLHCVLTKYKHDPANHVFPWIGHSPLPMYTLAVAFVSS